MKTVYGFSSGLRNGLPPASIITSKTDTNPSDTSPISGSIILGCSISTQCSGGRTCDATGNCNCPSGFIYDSFNFQQ